MDSNRLSQQAVVDLEKVIEEISCKYGLIGYLTDKELINFLLAEKEYEDTIIADSIKQIKEAVKAVGTPEGERFIINLDQLEYYLQQKHSELRDIKNSTMRVFGALRRNLKAVEQSDDLKETLQEMYSDKKRVKKVKSR